MSNNSVTPKQVLSKLRTPIRHEQLAKALNVTTKETGPVLRKLVSDGLVKTAGQKRATTYQSK